MKQRILIFIFAAFAFAAYGQNNLVKNAMVAYSNGAPTWTPGSFKANEISIDTLTGNWYEWKWTTNYTQGSWIASGYRVQSIAGCSAPLYTPGKLQSRLVINACPTPELYYYTGAAWVQVGGAAYTGGYGIDIASTVISADTSEVATPGYVRRVVRDSAYAISAGTGISISGSQTKVITNSAPDQTVSITGGGINTVSGTYPNFTVIGTEVDGSATNEIELPSQSGNNGKYLTTNGSSPSWATVSAGVSGAGLANRLAYWTGSGAIGYESTLYVDSTNSRLGVGVSSPISPLEVAQVSGNSSIKAGSFEIQPFAVNNSWFGENLYFDGTYFRHRAAGYGSLLYFYFGGLQVRTSGNKSAGSAADNNYGVIRFNVAQNGQTTINSTTNTGAFFNVSSNSTGDLIAQYHASATGQTNNLMIHGDGRIGMGVANPPQCAALDITSTTRGLLLPRMTTTQRDAIASPADGLLIYNTTASKVQARAGGAWVDLH